MMHFRRSTPDDLPGILALQRSNLPGSLSAGEMETEGFVTVVHSMAEITALNELEPHVIAADHGRVIAYLLAMTKASGTLITLLEPMFDLFNKISFGGKLVASYQFVVVGQVCVEKIYRGQGILDQCYQYYREQLQERYELAITEIDAKNLRSLNAHQRIGFTEIHRYATNDDQEWVVVAWDWR